MELSVGQGSADRPLHSGETALGLQDYMHGMTGEEPVRKGVVGQCKQEQGEPNCAVINCVGEGNDREHTGEHQD